MCCADFESLRDGGTPTAADAASRYDPLVKMRLERPAGRDKRQYKNKFSAEYPQSEAEGISNRSVTKKSRALFSENARLWEIMRYFAVL